MGLLSPAARVPWNPGAGDVISVLMEGPERSSRPALVLSPAAFSARTGVAIVCPVVAEVRGNPFEARLPPGNCVSGAVLADRVMSLDLRRCQFRLCGSMATDVLAAVLERLLPLLVRVEDSGELAALAALSRAYTHASRNESGEGRGLRGG